VAFVVLKAGETLGQAALTEFVAERLAKFKMPRAWFFRGEPLPKTGTNKILKRDLREQFWQDKTKRVQG
jgi:acyl-CoA synthetase (AMP-forming)/AMP-acid ligase II